jgi:CRP-like cAMP-binding protein
VSRDARREAAAALSRVRNPEFRSLLVPLIHDPDIDVARQAIASARVMGGGHALFVPALVSLLGHRVLKRDAREALLGYDDIVGILAYVLHDRDEHIWVRRHIPATLASIGGQTAVDALFAALREADGFLRYKIIEALETLRRRDNDLVFDTGVVDAQILKDTGRYYMYLSLRYNVVQHDPAAQSSLMIRVLDDKLARTVDRIYRLLSLNYPWRDIAAARAAIESQDIRRRAGAVEYLDQVLGGVVRKRVMPIVDVEPLAEKVRYANNIIKSRPRDLEETLVQLVHDDDSVVAAAAVTFVRQKPLWNLASDLAYIGERRTADPIVIEAAAWALASRGSSDAGGAVWPWMPVVEVADRLRAMPLFSVVFVDELFRIAASTRQVRHEPDRSLAEIGTEASEVQFLVDGAVQLKTAEGAGSTVTAPAILGFEEVLEGRPLSHAAVAVTPVECLVVKADDFLTMLTDNIALTQGVFRLLLASRSRGVWVSTPAVDLAAGGREPLPSPAAAAGTPLDKALRLRRTPLLSRAGVDQLLALAAAAQEIRFTAGHRLLTEAEPPAIFHVVTGKLRIEQDGQQVAVVGAGQSFGAAETLAGDGPRWQITADTDGEALRIDREVLFEVIAEHLELLQGLFSGALAGMASDQGLTPAVREDVAGRGLTLV